MACEEPHQRRPPSVRGVSVGEACPVGLRKALPVGPPQSRKRSNSSTPTRPHSVTGRRKTVPPPGLQGYGCGCSTQRKTPAKAEARSSIGSETNSTNACTGQASPTENTCHGTAFVTGHSGPWPQGQRISISQSAIDQKAGLEPPRAGRASRFSARYRYRLRHQRTRRFRRSEGRGRELESSRRRDRCRSPSSEARPDG